jgi:hypothetical protein
MPSIRRRSRLSLLVGAAAALLLLTTRLAAQPVAGASTAVEPAGPLAGPTISTRSRGCWLPGDLVGEANPASIAPMLATAADSC